MKSKEFYFLTWFVTVVSFSFVLISIWNTEWILVEKGFYTVLLGWITFSSFSLVKTLRDRADGIDSSPEYVFLAWSSMICSFSIGMIAVWNTDWILVEKGYYWLGLIFVTYSSVALSKELRDRQELKGFEVKEAVNKEYDFLDKGE